MRFNGFWWIVGGDGKVCAPTITIGIQLHLSLSLLFLTKVVCIFTRKCDSHTKQEQLSSAGLPCSSSFTQFRGIWRGSVYAHTFRHPYMLVCYELPKQGAVKEHSSVTALCLNTL